VYDSLYRIRIEGMDGDPIGDGLTSLITGSPGADNQNSPSTIFPVGGADSIFYYRIGGSCGIKYQGAYRIVYLSFGFEALVSLAAADTIMLRILRWFDVPVGVEEVASHQMPVHTAQYLKADPNPFRENLGIEYSVAASSIVELAVYDAAGRVVKKLVDEPRTAGVYRARWDGRDDTGRDLPSGVYFLKLGVDDFTASKKMVLVR
jgi:hypothetical protein